MNIDFEALARHNVCYLTTTGRVSQRPHTIEIWFALHEESIYLLSGGGVENADWVKNLLRQPAVTVKIGEMLFHGNACVVEDADEDALVRRLLKEKYQQADELEAWLGTALPVAIDLHG
jgi:deazaflavin-dependent oxidoreductase (nitroreductase family)